MPQRIALALSFVLVTAAQAAAQQNATRTLVVPFENTGNEPRLQWMGEAAAVLLTDGLRGRGVDAITRTERTRAFEHLHVPASASLSRATVIKVGQLVGAGDVIVGSFRIDAGQLTVQASSIRLDVGRVRPQASERGPLTDLFGIFERLATRVSGTVAATTDVAARPPLGAFENYVKGLIAESPATQATFLESALEEYRGFDLARLALWGVRTDQGDHAAALAAARAIPAQSPVSTRARFAAGVSLLELQRNDEAFAVLKTLLDQVAGAGASAASATPAILNNLGVALIRRGASAQTGTPVYYLTKAADLDPADTDCLFNLGYAYVLDRNYPGALYWLRETLRRDPADADAHFVLAAVLQASGSAVEASREKELARQLSSRYEELERRASSDKLPVPRGLERIRMDLDGSLSSAERGLVTSAQREQREQATFHLERGRRLFDREQDGEALLELRRAVYLSPYEADAHLLIGRLHLRAGRPAEAIDALKISIWSQDSPAARVTLAQAYLKAGDRAAARTQAEKALALDPASADAKRLLSELGVREQ